MHVVFQHFVKHEGEMRTFGAITIGISAFVITLRDSHIEYPFGFLNLRTDFRKIGDFQRRAVLFDNFHQVDAVEMKVVVNHFKSLLREIKGLFNEIAVGVLHKVGVAIKYNSSYPVQADREIVANVSNLD